MNNQFHIHVDALQLSPEFKAELTSAWGFYESNFSGHPEGAEGFEPTHHLTRKTGVGREFRHIFENVRAAAARPGALVGYIEGEYLPCDEDLPERAFDPTVVPPVAKLRLGNVSAGEFRESEIHIVMDADRSDPRLVTYLSSIGLFSAYMNKTYGRAVIFTAGGRRREVGALLDAFQGYLSVAGGTVHGSIKEERIVAYWISDSGLRLPPVVASIDWNGSR